MASRPKGITLLLFADERISRTLHHEAAVIISPENHLLLSSAIQGKAKELFPQACTANWVELHSSPMWNGTPDKSGRKTDWSIFSRDRIEAFFDFATTEIGRLSQNIIIQPLNKSDDPGVFYTQNPRFLALWFIVQRFDELCHVQDSVGLAFFDQESDSKATRERERELHHSILSKQAGPYSSPVTQQVQPPRSLSSASSTGIQVADLVAYVAGRKKASENGPKWDVDKMSLYFSNLGHVEMRGVWPKLSRAV